MSEIKLLKCPFCGGEAKVLRFPKCERKYVVICENEECMASVGVYSLTKEASIDKWNTRKPMQEIVEKLEEEVETTYLNKMEERVEKKQTTGFALGIRSAIEIVKEVGGMNE